MWMLHFVPDSYLLLIVNALLIAGAVSCFLNFFIINRIMRFFPPLAGFVGTAQLISVVLLLAGVYFKGSYQTEQEWRARVAEVEAKVAKAEAEAKQANIQLDKKAEVKIKLIKQHAQIVRQYVDREITKYDNTCVIPNEFVRAHNAAAKNEDLK